jgi:hypothetical protein
MNEEFMPEPLAAGVRRAVQESVGHLQEVVRFTHPDVAYDWPRMTMYRLGDAADTLNGIAMTITAYLEQQGVPTFDIRQFLQPSQERLRAGGPTAQDRAHLAGLLGDPGSGEGTSAMRLWGRAEASGELDVQQERVEVCLHALRAIEYDGDPMDCLGFLPPAVREVALRVIDALQPQTAPA